MKKMILPKEVIDLVSKEPIKDFSARPTLINCLQFGRTQDGEQAARWIKLAQELSDIPKDATEFHFEENDQAHLEKAIKESGLVAVIVNVLLEAITKAEAYSPNKKSD